MKNNHRTYSQSDWQAWFLSIVFSLSAALINAYGNEASTIVLMINSLVYNVPLNITFSATKIWHNTKSILRYVSDQKTSWPAKIRTSLILSYITVGSICYALAAALLASKKANTFSLKVSISAFSGSATFIQRYVGLTNKLLSVLNNKPKVQLRKTEPYKNNFTLNHVKQITVFIYPGNQLPKEEKKPNKWSYKIVSPAKIGLKSQIIHEETNCIEEQEIRAALSIENKIDRSEWENFQAIYITTPEVEQNLLEIKLIKSAIDDDNSLYKFFKSNFTIYNILHAGSVMPLLLLYTQSMLFGFEFLTGNQIWSTGEDDDKTAGSFNDKIFIIAAALTLPAVAYLPIVASGTLSAMRDSYKVFNKYLYFSGELQTDTHKNLSINSGYQQFDSNSNNTDLAVPLLLPEIKPDRKRQAVSALATIVLTLGSLGTTIGLATSGLALFNDKFSDIPGGSVLASIGATAIALEVAGTNLKPLLNLLIKTYQEKIQLIKQSRLYCGFMTSTHTPGNPNQNRDLESGWSYGAPR